MLTGGGGVGSGHVDGLVGGPVVPRGDVVAAGGGIVDGKVAGRVGRGGPHPQGIGAVPLANLNGRVLDRITRCSIGDMPVYRCHLDVDVEGTGALYVVRRRVR